MVGNGRNGGGGKGNREREGTVRRNCGTVGTVGKGTVERGRVGTVEQ